MKIIHNIPLKNYCIIFLLILATSSKGIPFEEVSKSFYGPFLISTNASLLLLNSRFSVGNELVYSHYDRNFLTSHGFSSVNETKGFGFCYYWNSGKIPNRFDIGFSQRFHSLLIGTCFKVTFSQPILYLGLIIDGSISYFFKRSFISMIIRNSVQSNTLANALPVDVSIVYSIQNFYDLLHSVFGVSLLYGGKKIINTYASYISNEFFFPVNKKFSIYMKCLADSIAIVNGGIKNKWVIENSFGIHPTILNMFFGIYVGITLNSAMNTKMQISSSFYPTSMKDASLLRSTLTLSTHDLFKDSIVSFLIIGISGSFKNKYTTLMRWNLCIYQNDTTQKKIVKSFSGGTLPPSAIEWDGRDTFGNLLPKGSYSVQFISIDSFNRVTFSESQEITIH